MRQSRRTTSTRRPIGRAQIGSSLSCSGQRKRNTERAIQIGSRGIGGSERVAELFLGIEQRAACVEHFERGESAERVARGRDLKCRARGGHELGAEKYDLSPCP